MAPVFCSQPGRMLDVFKRLHGTSEDFFTPHDFEVTYAELAYICDKARKWTHPRGTVALTTHRTTRQLVNRQLIVSAFACRASCIHRHEAPHRRVRLRADGPSRARVRQGGQSVSTLASQVERPNRQAGTQVNHPPFTWSVVRCMYESVTSEPCRSGWCVQVTTHLTIYNLEIDGSKTLYRHFLRMPDGTIIELFDVVAKSLGSQFDSLEKLLLSDQNVSGASARGFFSNFLS